MQTKERNKMRVTGKPSRAKPARPKKEPEIQVQYTPAKPFNRNRFLLHMATVLAVVIAVVLVVSIFFKVDQVLVSGAEKYTPWEIKEAAGIRDGDALLGLSEAKITARIQKKLPYVGDVRVGIKLPDTVNIEIKELDVVYAAEDTSGAWWLMDASGRLVDKTDTAAAKNRHPPQRPCSSDSAACTCQGAAARSDSDTHRTGEKRRAGHCGLGGCINPCGADPGV